MHLDYNILYLFPMFQTESFHSLAEQSLKKIVRNYKPNRFETLLLNFKNTGSLSNLVQQLFTNAAYLNLQLVDISDFLSEMGKHDTIKRQFEGQFYALWLEFYLIKFAQINERLPQISIDTLPKDTKQQLKYFKSLLISIMAAYTSSSEASLVEQLNSQALFKQLLDFRSKAISNSRSIRSSGRIGVGNSDLKAIQQQGVYLNMLEKISSQIGVIKTNKTIDCQLKKEELKKFFNTILESNNELESQILYINLKQIIRNYLGIKISRNRCTILLQQDSVTLEGFAKFKEFFDFQCVLSKLTQNKITFDDLIQQVRGKLNQGCCNIWYWPIYNDTSFAVYFFNLCIDDQDYLQQLASLISQFPPFLQNSLFTSTARPFLTEILHHVRNSTDSPIIFNRLLKLCRIQAIQLKKQQVYGETFEEMFRARKVNAHELDQIVEEQNSQDKIYIYDQKLRSRERIFISKEHIGQFIDKTKSDRFQEEQLNEMSYSLSFNLTNKYSEGEYTSGELNKLCQYGEDITYKGIINYGNLSIFGRLVKVFDFKILEKKNWRILELSPSQLDQLSDLILGNKSKAFSFKLLSIGLLLQFDLQTLVVRIFQESIAINSMIRQDFGYLIYFPAHKISNKDEPKELVDEYEEIFEDAFQMGQEGKKQEKRQSVITLADKFDYLGIFSRYFEKYDGFQIDEEFHVWARDSLTSEYFTRWRQETLCQLIESHLLGRFQMKESKPKNTFKIKKIFYASILQEFRQLEKKISKKVNIDWNQSKQEIIVSNMKDNPQSYLFFESLFRYLQLKLNAQQKKQNFVIKLNTDEQNYLAEKDENKIKIIGQDKHMVEVICTKQEKEKLLSEVEMLDKEHEFVYQNVQAFKLMRDHDDDGFLENLNYKFTQIDEEKFKISMKFRYHPQFQQRLKLFCDDLAQIQGVKKQRKIDSEGEYLHVYQQALAPYDIQVSKMGDHILLQYNSRQEKQLNEALKKIEGQKLKWAYQYTKKSSSEIIIKNIEPKLLFELKKRLQIILKQKSKNYLKPIVEIDQLDHNEYSLKAVQIDKQLEKIFSDSVESFGRNYNIFLRMKKKLLLTQKFFNQCFSCLPNKKLSHSYKKNMYFTLKKTLKECLSSKIQPISKRNIISLQEKILNYIRNTDLMSDFVSNLLQEQDSLIKKEINGLNIFHTFMEEWVNMIKKSSKVQTGGLKIFDKMKVKNSLLLQKMQNKRLVIVDMANYFKSLNVLGKIYFGEQLPITQHLQKFEYLLQNNDVVLVKVGTGSGKSTVIPPFLVGLGYEKVVVTQPRRLPCREIFKRIVSVFGPGIAGYQISGQQQERENSLVYTTDGLLKTNILFNESVLDAIDVLVIDEIHQRSANIDMLLLFLSQYYQQKKRKLKLVLCSATIDKDISKIIKETNLKIANFQVEVQRYPVTEHIIDSGSIIQRVLLICKKLKGDEQLLVFYPGVKQVINSVTILQQKFNREAFPIFGNQNPIEQEKILQQGQIFIATSIAETSLTFRNLRYAIDSRTSRWLQFDCTTQLMETKQEYSSNSSIKQRKGRVGRTCPGEYHYFAYHNHDFSKNREHNATQLEKVDITNYVFQLLLRKNTSFQMAKNLLKKLNKNEQQFQKKINYSYRILSDLCIITSSGNLMNGAEKLILFGDLGNPQHNLALYQAKNANCLMNMIYLVSFFMMGVNALKDIISYLKIQKQAKSDIRAIHDFLLEIGAKINLPHIDANEIKAELRKNCPNVYKKPWGPLLCRVLGKACQLLKHCTNYVPNTDWNKIIGILLLCYRNKIFFNQSIFGGNKNFYEKCRANAVFDYEKKVDDPSSHNQNIYQLNLQSFVYRKDNPSNILISISCMVNPQNQCILNFCEEVDESLIDQNIIVAIHGCQCKDQYLKTNDKCIDEKTVFSQFQQSLNIKTSNKFPVFQMTGPLNLMMNGFRNTVEPRRRNAEVRIDMNKMLDEAIRTRQNRLKRDSLMPVIDPQNSKKMFLKLNFNNFRDMFQTTKYDMQNNYGVNIEWELVAIDRFLIVKNAKNMHIDKLMTKLLNFFRWFADSQLICNEDFKIHPRYIEENQILSSEARLKIMERVNQIVDSQIQPYVIKSWTNGKGPCTKYPRTARMIVACWVLVNKFSCSIKGGFVRDWIVNGQEVVPAGDLSNLLQKNARNQFLQVIDDSVTPSDIDAELSHTVLFAQDRFKKEMGNYGIHVKIEEDGWRKHVIFDEGVASGGFTADLIEPYTSICHDSYDFDVNTMYIKKDHLNSIGMKIPLEYVDNYNHKTTKVSLEELISLCRSKKMKMMKHNIPKYRFKKFEQRKWTINKQQIFEPICYKSLTTQSSPVDVTLIGKISKTFENIMILAGPKVTVVRIQSLKNKSWDETFESVEHWIVCELENAEKAKNPNGYYKTKFHSNTALLFHGTKNNAHKSIKQFGFDSRYYGDYGFYGRGAYFADDPTISHNFTSPDADGLRYMFIVKVALGNREEINKEQAKKLGPSKGFHYIYGTGRPHKQYIVDRWGQAKPVYLITYK